MNDYSSNKTTTLMMLRFYQDCNFNEPVFVSETIFKTDYAFDAAEILIRLYDFNETTILIRLHV